MQIGVIGAGAMARALGGGWAAAGHEIYFGARRTEAAGELAADVGYSARGGSIEEAARFGEAVLLAVPVDGLDVILRATAGLDGRVLIDCTNAFEPDTAAPDGAAGFVLAEDAVAERIAATVPTARVVKAFNLCAAEVWADDAREFEGTPLSVPLCGDDPDAVRVVAGLAEDLKLKPFLAGGLHRARYLEAASALTVGLWFAGYDSRAMLPPLSAAFAARD
ncbi:NADPH-dependent F420 reductase [Nocardia lijiangensis]|uniref:NADPH-dependent F420 reductase n=1 Tax=Nocardia lijiangensis TaxID=299618 RepID=UPI003D733D60